MFFFKQKTAYEMRISDWSSDVCSSDLPEPRPIMKIYKTKPCKRCGNLFTPTSPCNTYCSTDCRGKNAYYIRNYGITQDDLEAMKTEQGHNCLTCGGPGFLIGNNGHSERLVVDQDRKSTRLNSSH